MEVILETGDDAKLEDVKVEVEQHPGPVPQPEVAQDPHPVHEPPEVARGAGEGAGGAGGGPGARP